MLYILNRPTCVPNVTKPWFRYKYRGQVRGAGGPAETPPSASLGGHFYCALNRARIHTGRRATPLRDKYRGQVRGRGG